MAISLTIFVSECFCGSSTVSHYSEGFKSHILSFMKIYLSAILHFINQNRYIL